MTAKDYLKRIRRNEIHIAQKKVQIDTISTNYTYLKGLQYGDKVQTSPRDMIGDEVARALDQLNDLRVELAAQMNDLERERDLIIKQIQSMEKAEYCDLLFTRYVVGVDLLTIAEKMGYEYGSIRNMHGMALQAFAAQFLA